MTKFKEINLESYKEHLCQAYQFNIQNNNDIRAFQMIYPDKNGIWREDSPDKDFVKNTIILD
jgi:hypothetical protein